MKTLKRMLLFYLINVTIWILMRFILWHNFFWEIKNPPTWIFALFPVLIAQFISFLIYQGGKENHSPLKNTITYLVCAAILNGLVFSDLYSDWKREKETGNIESNRIFFDMRSPVPNNAETKIAFDTLIKKFETENDIELTESTTRPAKTFINESNLPDTLFEVRFRYKKQDAKYKARLLVYNSQAQLLYYDQPLNRKDVIEDDFQKRKQRYEMKGIFKQLPDSIRNEVEEAFKDF